MRKLISLMHMSLDGYMAGPAGEMNWIKMDDDMFSEVSESFKTVDTALYGRVTYGMMKGYWPTVATNPASSPHQLQHARWVHEVEKVIISTTLTDAGWNNTHVIHRNVEAEILELKKRTGQDIMIFGSPRLTHSLLNSGLIDEYRLSISPIVLGGGTPYFANVAKPIALTLAYSKQLPSGAMMMVYRKA